MGTVVALEAAVSAASVRKAWGLRCCTNDEALGEWLRFAGEVQYLTHAGATRQTYCLDCEPEFEHLMKRLGRCLHGTPRELDWQLIRGEGEI